MLYEDIDGYRERFFEIVQDCRGGKTTKEQALRLLEGASRFALIDNEAVIKHFNETMALNNPDCRICGRVELEDFEIKQNAIRNGQIENEYTIQKAEIENMKSFSPEAPEEKNYFLTILKSDFPLLFKAIINAMESGLVKHTDNDKFDFNCGKGATAHFFKIGGCTDWARVRDWVTVKGKETDPGSMGTLANNAPPKDFDIINKTYF